MGIEIDIKKVFLMLPSEHHVVSLAAVVLGCHATTLWAGSVVA